jgi:hypothetical protein
MSETYNFIKENIDFVPVVGTVAKKILDAFHVKGSTPETHPDIPMLGFFKPISDGLNSILPKGFEAGIQQIDSDASKPRGIHNVKVILQKDGSHIADIAFLRWGSMEKNFIAYKFSNPSNALNSFLDLSDIKSSEGKTSIPPNGAFNEWLKAFFSLNFSDEKVGNDVTNETKYQQTLKSGFNLDFKNPIVVIGLILIVGYMIYKFSKGK